MSIQEQAGQTPITSLDLLRELQGEQKAFRFLVRALAVLLVTAAIIELRLAPHRPVAHTFQ